MANPRCNLGNREPWTFGGSVFFGLGPLADNWPVDNVPISSNYVRIKGREREIKGEKCTCTEKGQLIRRVISQFGCWKVDRSSRVAMQWKVTRARCCDSARIRQLECVRCRTIKYCNRDNELMSNGGGGHRQKESSARNIQWRLRALFWR